MKTQAIKQKDISRNWLHVDAKDQVVGRVASAIAMFLTGKHKVMFSPSVDNGDFVIVTNAEKVVFTGNKWENKPYRRHTHHVGGLRTTMAKDMLKKNPSYILKSAVWGMMPKTNHARRQLMKLKIYTGDSHPHAVQNQKAVKIGPKGKVLV